MVYFDWRTVLLNDRSCLGGVTQRVVEQGANPTRKRTSPRKTVHEHIFGDGRGLGEQIVWLWLVRLFSGRGMSGGELAG